MGRQPGSQNKAKHSANMPEIMPSQAQKAKPPGSSCLGCGAKMSMQPSILGERCVKCFRINPNGQKVTGGYRHDRFKVKELNGPRFNAAFMVIDYAM